MRITFTALLACLLFFLFSSVAADPGTTFSYQGRLANGSTPIETPVDSRLSLFDALSGGSQIGSDITFLNTAYDGGIVQQPLYFGASAFNGAPRFLEVEVADPAGSAFTILSDRIQLAPVPYAIYAETSGSSEGIDGHSLNAADGDPIDAVFVDNDGLIRVGTSTPAAGLDVAAAGDLEPPILTQTEVAVDNNDGFTSLNRPRGVALSDDGRFAYVTSVDDDAFTANEEFG